MITKDYEVVLVGVSQHGKNRVHEQGAKWMVLEARSAIASTKHRRCPGPFWLITNGDVMRWISTKDDPDFIILEGFTWEDD